MSGFYIGQRVKKVRGEHLGHVACVVGNRDELLLVLLIEGGGCTNFGRPVGPGSRVWSKACLWEPILPPGLESLEEINALYEPSPAEVRA